MQREQKAITASVEGKILNFLVSKLPLWVTPDILTYSALGASFAIGICYALSDQYDNNLILASILLVYHWFADGLDGRLARFRKIERPKYGHYIDHIFDAISSSFILGGLYLSPLTKTPFGLVVIIVYLLLMTHAFLKSSITGKFELSIGKLGPTEGRLLLIAINIFLLVNGNILIGKYSFLDFITIIAAVFMTFTFIKEVAKTAALLEREDKKASTEN